MHTSDRPLRDRVSRRPRRARSDPGGRRVWALFAPSSFYGDFPFGRGWVAALPAYNEHLTRDVGELFLAIGLVLLVAAYYLERRLVVTAICSYLVWSVPHAIYHAFHLDAYGTADAIGNVVTLALTRDPAPLAAGSPLERIPAASAHPLAASASRASTRPAGSWRSASTCTSRPGLARRLAGHRADRDDPGVAREPVADRGEQVADGRGRGEGDVVGRLRPPRSPPGRAPRGPSRRARRRRRARRARASASGSTSRASAARATSTGRPRDVDRRRAPRPAPRRRSARERRRRSPRARPARRRCRGRSRRRWRWRARARRGPASAIASNSSRTPFGLVRQTSA